MSILDVAAWVVIALLVVFGVLPFIFSDRHTSYLESLAIGFCFLLVLVLLGVTLFTVLWAFDRVIF